MSRFFATGSESESESSSSEEEQVPQKVQGITSAFTFSDEEEETKRIVRSAREKRYEELIEIIKLIRNHKKIKDMSKLLTSFENLARAFIKARLVIEKEERGVTPKFYVRCLVELEDFITDCWEDRDGRKNMSKNNSKCLGALRQKLRKYNKDFESDIATYRENPEAEDEEKDEEEEEPVSEDDEKPTDFLKKAPKIEKEEPKSKLLKGSDDEDSEDDSIDWGSTSEGESSLSSDDEKYGGNLAIKFLKKAGDKDEQKESTKREKKRDKERKERKKDEDDEGWEEVRGGAVIVMEKPKMFAKDAEINHQVVIKKFNEILAARGKKGTDRSEQIELLVELLNICEAHTLGEGVRLKIIFAIVSAIFDYNPNISTCMKGDMWQKCLEYIVLLLDTILEHTNITVGEHISEESENVTIVPYRIKGCCLTVVERMDEEFTKMLQGCDAHSPEYVERLKDEKMVCHIIERLQTYLENRGTPSELCRIYLRRIEHLYYKFDASVFEAASENSEQNGHVEEEEEGKAVEVKNEVEEDKKTEESGVVESSAEGVKVDDDKAGGNKVDDVKAGEDQADDGKASEDQADDVKASEDQADDVKASEDQADDVKASEDQADDVKASEDQADDVKASEDQADDSSISLTSQVDKAHNSMAHFDKAHNSMAHFDKAHISVTLTKYKTN